MPLNLVERLRSALSPDNFIDQVVIGDGKIPECPYCKESAEEKAVSDKIVGDLSQLVCRLVRSLRKSAPDNDLSEKALDYLKRNGLLGSPLRGYDAGFKDGKFNRAGE